MVGEGLRLLKMEGFTRTSGVMPQARRTWGTLAVGDAPVTPHLPCGAGYRVSHIGVVARGLERIPWYCIAAGRQTDRQTDNFRRPSP